MLILSLRVPHLVVQPVSDHDSSEIESDTVKCCFWYHEFSQNCENTNHFSISHSHWNPKSKYFAGAKNRRNKQKTIQACPGSLIWTATVHTQRNFDFRLKTSDQENRTRKPYRNPTMMNDLIFKKHVKNISLESETGGFVGFVHGRPRWHGWQQLAHSEM